MVKEVIDAILNVNESERFDPKKVYDVLELNDYEE